MHNSLSPSPHSPSPLSSYHYNYNYNYHTPSPYHTPTKQTPPHSVMITHHSSSPKKYSRYISTHLLSPVHDNYTTSHSIITFSPPSTPHLLIIDQSQPISPIPNVPLPKKQPAILSSLLDRPKTTILTEQKSDDNSSSGGNANNNNPSPPTSPTQQENKPNTPENVKKTTDTSDDTTQKEIQHASKSHHPQHHSVPVKSASSFTDPSSAENDQLLRAKSQPTIKNRYDDSPSTDKKKSKPNNKSKNHSEKVFGVPLKVLLEKEAYFCIAVNPWVPEIVEELMCYLYEENAIKSEGLFRQSGTVVDVNYIKTMYDKGKYLDLMMYDNPHVIASALKLFLKEIPDPLIPYSAYNHFIKFQQDSQNNLSKTTSNSPESKDNKTPKYSMEYLRGLRDLLFTYVVYECLVLLKLLAQLLVRVVKYERYNRMTPSNLAIVIGPNIIRSKDIDPFLAMAHYSHVAQITESIIRNEQFLFDGYKNLALNDVSLEALVNKRGLWSR